ncbi:MAG TPA: helix-turn-helix transcriptional regulator [Ferruginibacter sp.]|nr:helix-turn-helix transcriptional regulator [Ferruginibacter sp.]
MNETDLLTKLGNRIKAIRKKKGMSQNELALECDFEKASMSRIEAGLANPTVRTLFKISRALDVPMAELFKG